MLPNEEVMAICCGIGWLAAATDKRRLRIFSTAGIQREIMTLPGMVVAMAGYKNYLIVAVHLGMPVYNDQHIGYVIYDVMGYGKHPMPNVQV